MKFNWFKCEFCRKRMEPRIEIKKRFFTTDEHIYYCVLCGKQLLILGRSSEKLSWLILARIPAFRVFL